MKVQIWLRVDQAECAIQSLDFLLYLFSCMRGLPYETHVLAVNLSIARIKEVKDIINTALITKDPLWKAYLDGR